MRRAWYTARLRIYLLRTASSGVMAALLLLAVACGTDDNARADSAATTRAFSADLDIGDLFAGGEPVDAAFVLLDGATGAVRRYGADRAATDLLPASTFKIPNALIALETGVATGADHTRRFDRAVIPASGFWSQDWSRDHTLASAFQTSAVWYFQTLAREIGDARMRTYLARFAYGNQDLSGGIERFWLGGGGLRISPDEQVRFLERFYTGRLGVSAQTQATMKAIMVLERTPDYTLSGKTGTADVTPTRELGWLVGFVERAGQVWYYALNVEGEDVWERWGHPLARRALVVEILRRAGVLPPTGVP